MLASDKTPRLRVAGIPFPSTPVINKPGTINLKAAEKINQSIKDYLSTKKLQTIIIDGEEDLLALPAILFAPLNSLVLYGHWQYGIIGIVVNENTKDKIINILNKFI